MAEHSFQEVMRQYKRMCRGEECNGCDFYKFKTSLSHQMACLRFLKEYPVEAEALVMNWAAEHPEPVYPTWAEYLNSIGVTISDRPFPAPNIPVYVYQAGAKMFEPIPAEIAKKLGIEPKEG